MSEKKKPRLVVCRIPARDGFTLDDVYREGEDIIYAGVAIQYRPALQTQTSEFLDDPRAYLVKSRALVLKHVTGWNVAGDNPAEAAPITEEVVAELAYPVLTWMVNCITGYAPRTEVDDAKN